MKKTISFVPILLLTASICFAQNKASDHVKIIGDFNRDLAIALDTQTGKKGIINRDGEIQVALVYNEVTRFENGFYKIITFKRKQQVGLVNKKGEIVIKPKKFSSIWLARKPNGAYKFQLTKEYSEKVFYLAENGTTEVDWSAD